MDIFKKDMNITDTLLNIAKVTPEMVNIILQSTINLDMVGFIFPTCYAFECSLSSVRALLRI